MSRGGVLCVIAYSEQGLVRFVQCKAFVRQDLEYKHVPAVFLCRFCGFVNHAKLLRS